MKGRFGRAALCALFFTSALPADVLRVRLFRDSPPKVLKIGFQSGRTISLNGMHPPARPLHLSHVKWIQPDGRKARRTPSNIEVLPKSGRLLVRAVVDLEEYVAAVLADEAHGYRRLECDKATAVVVRSYALRNLRRHKQDGFDLCDTWHCQRFRFDFIPPGVRRAVTDTKGEIVLQGAEPAPVFYHKDCGGHTESAAAAWGIAPMSHLSGIADPICERTSRSWRLRITPAALKQALQLYADPEISIVERTGSGRVLAVSINAKRHQPVDFERAISRKLGRSQFPGQRYQVRRDAGYWIVEGRGWGHGVGLCQQGARRRAESGQEYRDILNTYFPGTWIGSLATDRTVLASQPVLH